MGRDPASNTRRAREAPALTAFVDTNVLIRHLTGDPPDLAARATSALAGSEPLLLTDLIVGECVFVLESYYELDRQPIGALLNAAIVLPSIVVTDEALLRRALAVYEVDRVDFAEAYLVAHAEMTGVGEILSFDRSLDRVASVTRREP